MAKKEIEWWHDFFPTFRPVFGMIPPKVINAQIRYVIKKLNLKPGKSFLDCPCGVGRFALPMAARGIKVTGVDFMASYLEEIRTKAARRGLKLELQQNDMRRIDFKNRFDAAANLWTSFGYFSKESDDLLVLKKMWKALKPGGRFMLHVINRDWIMANFQSSDWLEIAGLKVLEKRSFDYATSTSHGTWCFIKDGKEKAHDVSLRMYSYHELIAMFKKVGFIDIQGYGSIKDEPISRDSRMIFVIGTKP